jgi:hypothetical protein
MTVTLGMEQLPLLERLIVVLNEERDPVKWQQAIELLTSRHCLGARDRNVSLQIADGVHKHVRQMIEQAYREGWIDERA